MFFSIIEESIIRQKFKPKFISFIYRSKYKAEISGYFGDSVVACDIFQEDVTWEDVLLKETLERMFS